MITKSKTRRYIIEVDGSFYGEYSTRKLANEALLNINANKVKFNIDLIKENTVQTVVKSYKPKVSKVLVIDDFELDLEGESYESK